MSVFENGQFSRHFKNFLQKKMFLGEKTFFISINKNFVFLKKNIFLFFEKKCFLEIFFRKKFFFKIPKSFPPIKYLQKFFFNFFEKKFPKKKLFGKKKKNVFFQKNKVYRGKKIFFSKKKIFLSKKNVR